MNERVSTEDLLVSSRTNLAIDKQPIMHCFKHRPLFGQQAQEVSVSIYLPEVLGALMGNQRLCRTKWHSATFCEGWNQTEIDRNMTNKVGTAPRALIGSH